MIKLGQKLREERLRKKLTLEDVSRATKIKEHFLACIERGEYDKLPSSAYVVGFVRNYVTYLGLPERQSLALFRREYDEHKEFKVLPESLTKDRIPKRTIKVPQAGIFLTAVVLAIFVYLFFQYRYTLLSPPLFVDVPKENGTYGRELVITGRSDSNATIYINNEAVIIEENGTFEKRLSLFPGKTQIEVKAVNRVGKETVVVRNITVK